MGTYGYIGETPARESAEKQQKQIKEKFGDIEICTDTINSVRKGRKALYTLLEKLQKGDTLVIIGLNVLADNGEEAYRIVQDLIDRKINIEMVREPYFGTEAYVNTGLNYSDISKERYSRRLIQKQISAYFDLMEKDSIIRKERLLESEKKGKQYGKPEGYHDAEKIKEATQIILTENKAFGGNATDAEIIRKTNMKKRSFYYLKKSLKDEKTRNE